MSLGVEGQTSRVQLLLRVTQVVETVKVEEVHQLLKVQGEKILKSCARNSELGACGYLNIYIMKNAIFLHCHLSEFDCKYVIFNRVYQKYTFLKGRLA